MISSYNLMEHFNEQMRKATAHKVKMSEIKNVLTTEFNCLASLLPWRFRKDFKKYAYIAGGGIYRLYHDEEPKDYDFFLADEKFTKKIIAYFSRKNNFSKYKGYQLVVTDFAITIGKYQIVTKYVGLPNNVVTEFDFKHNMFVFWHGIIRGFVDDKYLQGRDLVFNEHRARDICNTVLRIPKFVERGMKITRNETRKILRQLYESGFTEDEIDAIHRTSHITY